MKRKLWLLIYAFLLVALVLPATSVFAQDCSSLQLSYTTTESRCMATGSVTIQVTGGSGSYNYKVTGPVTTNFTSSSTITGLQAGTYTVIVKDINRGCQVEKEGVVVAGSYQDPRFALSATDVTCAGNDGTITVNSQQYGRSPFTYTIIAPSPSQVGVTNSTGSFSNLLPGEYAIQLKDSCGGIQVRRITVQSYSWWFDGITVTKVDCNTADATIRLKDNKGNITATAFTGFQYGVVNAPGDTTWFSTSSFRFSTQKKLTATFVAKDPCGKVHASVWSIPANAKPAVGNINYSNTTCNSFTATVSGQQNLTNAQYELYVDGSPRTFVTANNTGVFTGLAYGNYCIYVKDGCYDTTIVKCFSRAAPTISLNAAPSISNRTCNTFTASLSGTNLTNPEYCLYDAAKNKLECNNTGTFNNISYGSYCIKVTDGCTGATLERCFTENAPVPTITNHNIYGQGCSTFNVSATANNIINPEYCLYDKDGNVVRCNNTGVFTDVPFGYYCIKVTSCGITSAGRCFTVNKPQPSIGATVQTSNKTCSTFTAAVTNKSNLTSPTFELYNSAKQLVATNNSGTFHNLAYGSYCIKLIDGCNNTTIERCFEEQQPKPAVNATIQQSNATCSTFTATVTGTNFTNPQYCIYNAADQLVDCNATGVFNNLAYGTYCITVKDGCYDTTIRVCQTFAMDYALTLATSKSCTFGHANIDISFTNGIAPYTIRAYDPNGVLVHTATTSTGAASLVLPTLPAGLKYTITGTDNCGRTDSKTITPDATIVTNSITARAKCPSSTWQNGSGDLEVTSSSNWKNVTPAIIKKDGATFNRTYSSNTGNTYIFSDLEPATYIIAYSMKDCSSQLYDTFVLKPYTFPTQGRSAIYQCDNNSFSLGADVTGGIGPYKYQIIGSEPEIPSITSEEQSSPLFTINTGTVYSLVRLRTIDACGNATLNDVSVLPLQNVIMKASRDCFYQDVVLSVDTIPNAKYEWYKRTGLEDSVLLTTDITYNLPFMRPEDVGTYICKVTVNDGCMIRIASYTLTGDCGYIHLPVSVQLNGKKAASGNELTWTGSDAPNVVAYIVERKSSNDTGFTAIGKWDAFQRSYRKEFRFTDSHVAAGTSVYRIKTVTASGNFAYSNMVALSSGNSVTVVYPNPVVNEFQVMISGERPATYHIELHNAAGQVVEKSELKNVVQTTLRYSRNRHLQAGMYLLKVINTTSGKTEHFKLLFK